MLGNKAPTQDGEIAASDENKEDGSISQKKLEFPRKNYNAYFHFVLEQEDIISKQDPSMLQTEVISLVSKKWNSLTDSEKKKYDQIAEEDKIRYDQELKEYLRRVKTSNLQNSKEKKAKIENQIKEARNDQKSEVNKEEEEKEDEEEDNNNNNEQIPMIKKKRRRKENKKEDEEEEEEKKEDKDEEEEKEKIRKKKNRRKQ
ncbi:MAG: hypothetical protein EZS28_030487 [Streblomastix strix]|uniref:HMG box domain-containing protein n=1 Tax=Streblomastix strix TaxID=222440 RepID=A0A5J4UW29_9EUKA|nr:MAG: hypothetical protein EZS28_030487 [Streblomastix strix]